MSPKILFWIFTLLGAGLEIIGDVFFKRWTIEHKSMLIWAGFFIYAIGALCWAVSLKYELLSKAISIFTVLNLVIVSLIGIFFFKEDISVLGKIGILLGILSIVLIERG